MDERDALIVKKYIDTCIIEPDYRDKHAFSWYSYSKWAANDILTLVLEEIEKPPPIVTGKPAMDFIELASRYAYDMEYYSDIRTEWKYQKPFHIAKETAYDLIYFYMKERRYYL